MAENELNNEDLSLIPDGEEEMENSELLNETDPVAGKTDPEAETDPLEDARQEIGELKDKYLRLYAEFENFRKRNIREKMELVSHANAELLKSLLPILDDFERALAAFDKREKEADPLKQGVDLIFSKLIKTLENEGLRSVDAQGKKFDADLHESVAQFPAADEQGKGMIVDVIEKGYNLNDKVLRYAKVVVGV